MTWRVSAGSKIDSIINGGEVQKEKLHGKGREVTCDCAGSAKGQESGKWLSLNRIVDCPSRRREHGDRRLTQPATAYILLILHSIFQSGLGIKGRSEPVAFAEGTKLGGTISEGLSVAGRAG